MKHKILIFSIIISAIVAIILFFAIGPKVVGTPSPKPLSMEEARTLYANSLRAIQNAQDKIVSVNTTNEINYNGSLFTEHLVRSEIYNCFGTDNPIILVDEQMQIGAHRIHNSEIYADGKAYLTIDGSKFIADCPKDELPNRLTPSILLDATLYNDISGLDTGTEYTITFSSPISAESWLPLHGSTLINAYGTASISYDGQLCSSTYLISYTLGNTTVTKAVTADTQLVFNEITVPTDVDAHIPISHLDGPRTLEHISGFLTQSECISSTYTDSIYFEALGDKREQSITLHAYKDSQWSAAVQTSIILSNDGHANQQTTHTKLETYVDNIYSVQADDNAEIANPDITEDDVRLYLQNLLLSTVMLPKYIASAELEETESALNITYLGTEDFAKFLRENAGALLYQDSTLLNNADSTIHTTELICHITLDKQTGLPLSSGIYYSANYTAEGLPYQLHYHADQKYTFSSSETLTNINKAAGN